MSSESKSSAPQRTIHQETRSGDPFHAAGDERVAERLRRLEEKLAHELMDVEARCRLEDQVRRLRRRHDGEER
jgi:hypothetical protein